MDENDEIQAKSNSINKPHGVTAPGNAQKKRPRRRSKVHRSPKEKRERKWGKVPQKPYISSSLGDMARVMMRFACMESTYFYHTEPPPVEFYDYWKKFSVDASTLPSEFIDRKKQSHANIRKNTSSFDFFGKHCFPIHSSHDMEDVAETGGPAKNKLANVDLSDIWQDVRISMSNESFISTSTKVSENGSMVPIETGWDDACSEDYQSSESDFGIDVQDRNRHHRHRQHQLWAAAGRIDSKPHHPADDKKRSSLDFHTPQGLMEKQYNAIAQDILAMQKKDNRIIYELAMKPPDMDLIDHFADDLDDSFLLDSVSYSDLPDNVFGPDFDFLNEDKIYKKKGGKKEKKENQTKKREGGKSKEDAEGDDDDVVDVDDSNKSGSGTNTREKECEKEDKQCKIKKRKKKKSGKVKQTVSQVSEGDTNEEGYEACMERRRRRIEDGLRAAVRQRSPMGSFRPQPGQKPLATTFMMSSPGPGAYNPSMKAVTPNIHTALIVPRYRANIYETLGPGPSGYLPDPKCTCEMLTKHETPRFVDEKTIGPGPANVNLSHFKGAGSPPNALIVSRKNIKDFVSTGEFTNCYGLTRFGKAHPPNPVIVSRNLIEKIGEPGPGEYDPDFRKDTKIGIKLKSRLDKEEPDVSPGFHALPDLIRPDAGFTFGIKNFMERKDQSPGPIYRLPENQPQPVSLTFKPFPMRGATLEPSPLEWGVKPGIAKLKTLRRAPDPFLHGSHDKAYPESMSPGPIYGICDKCMPCGEPGATIKGRCRTKIEVMPGPADYYPEPIRKRAPEPVFQHKWRVEKDKTDWVRKMYGDGGTLLNKKIKGGLMSGRWNSKGQESGPELLNTFGLHYKGKSGAIPISLKSRHTPFKFSHLSDPIEIHREDDKQCVMPPTKMNESKC